MAAAGSDFIGQFVGQSTVQLRSFLQEARDKAPCVIFIDEIDSIGSTRKEDTGAARDRADVVNTLLTALDGFSADADVFLIAATNHIDHLDKALLRPGRLDRKILVDLPSLEDRREILRQKLARVRNKVDLDWVAGGSFRLSGAELVRIVDDAKLLALKESGDVVLKTEHVRNAMDRLTYGQTPGNASRPTDLVQARRERTAWHESGHLVLHLLLEGFAPHRVSIVPRGSAGGFVSFSEEDMDRMSDLTRSRAIRQLAVMLGGGAAEAIQLEEASSGVSKDREMAAKLAHAMVASWGMGSTEAEVAARLQSTGERSDMVVQDVAAILEEALELSDRTLRDHFESLQRAVELLLDHEQLTRSEILEHLGDLIER